MRGRHLPHWLGDTREDLQEVPAYLLALVIALGLGCGILVTWWKD